MLIKKNIRFFVVLGLLLGFYGCGDDKEVFVFNPQDGLKYTEFVSVNKVITSLSGANKNSTKITLENDVEIKKTGSGFEYIVTTKKARQTVDGSVINNPVLGGMISTDIIYDIRKNGKILDISGYGKVAKRALASMSSKAVEENKQKLTGDNLKAQEMINWKDKFENLIGKSAKVGYSWVDVKNIDLPTGGISQYYSSSKVEKVAKCDGKEKCLLISYTFHRDRDSLNDKNIPELDMGLGGADDSDGYSINSVVVSGKGSRVIDPKTMVVYRDSSTLLIVMEITIENKGSQEIKTEMKTSYLIKVKQ